MSVNVKYKDDNGIYVDGNGVFTDDDLARANEIIYSDDDQIKNIAYQVIDLSKCEAIELSKSSIKRSGELNRKALSKNPKMRMAVYGSCDLTYGLGRMWVVYACHFSDHEDSCGVFRHREDIEKWIKSDA